MVVWLNAFKWLGKKHKIFTDEESALANARAAEIDRWNNMSIVERYARYKQRKLGMKCPYKRIES